MSEWVRYFEKEYDTPASVNFIFGIDIMKSDQVNLTFVALIDTGVDINHPDLAGRMVDGWNFIDDTETVYNSNNPVESTHGTYVPNITAIM